MTDMAAILHALHPGEEYVLGTVVDVMGSAYRQPGARVLIRRDGSRVGMISGGCLDKDVARHAWAWTEDGPLCALYDTRSDALHPHGKYGSGCDGVVKILLERVTSDSPLVAQVFQCWNAKRALRAVTLFEAVGTPDKWVGRHIFTEDDLPELPIGLRCTLEEALRRPLTSGRACTLTWEGANASVHAFIEDIHAPLELVIFGAGDDAQPLCAMAQVMGWSVVVADKWPALATETRFPGAHVCCARPEATLDSLRLGPHTYVVMMTHNFQDDLKLLPQILERDVPWVGLMGPRRRTMKLMKALMMAGKMPSAEAIARVQTPVGADLGADAPQEVTLSVLAGLVAAKNGASAGLLRDSASSAIHVKHERAPAAEEVAS